MTPIAAQESIATQGARLQAIFDRNAARVAIVDARLEEEITYGQLWRDSRAAAALLDELGVRAGDAVVLSMENCVELALLYFACLHIGARVVPINPSYHAQDYATILAGVSARHCFTSPSVRGRIDEVVRSRPDVLVHCLLPTVETCRAEQQTLINLDLRAEIAGREPFARTLADSDDDTIAFTMYSSGTTGLPKGINIRLGGLLGNALAFIKRLGITREHRFYNVLAMTYLGGLYNLMLIPLLAEGSLVLDSVFGPTNAYGFWEQVRNYQINTLWFSPTMLSMLLMIDPDEDETFIRQQVRLGLCGMAPLSHELKVRFETRFGFPLHENYGLSETTFVTTNAPQDGPAKPGAVGKVVEGVQIGIFDNEMKPLAQGHEGQVGVRSPFLMAGYEGEVEIEAYTARTNGWFLTGDLGRIGEDGELYITGRLKDLIIRGGVNISPKAIEDVVYRFEPVQEAAVVGVSHPLYGEEVALVAKIRPGDTERVKVEDLRQFCDQNLANFQRPKFIYFIDQIPKGATGKIQKSVLRKLLQDKLDPLHG